MQVFDVIKKLHSGFSLLVVTRREMLRSRLSSLFVILNTCLTQSPLCNEKMPVTKIELVLENYYYVRQGKIRNQLPLWCNQNVASFGMTWLKILRLHLRITPFSPLQCTSTASSNFCIFFFHLVMAGWLDEKLFQTWKLWLVYKLLWLPNRHFFFLFF